MLTEASKACSLALAHIVDDALAASVCTPEEMAHKLIAGVVTVSRCNNFNVETRMKLVDLLEHLLGVTPI